MDAPRPPADLGGDDELIRLRSALGEALRARDMVAVAALRSVLSAIGNAEAVSPAPGGAGGEYFAGAVAGVGATEARRRTLGAAEIRQIVRAEVGERLRAAGEYERAGHAGQAARLRSEVRVLTSVMADGRQPGAEPAG